MHIMWKCLGCKSMVLLKHWEKALVHYTIKYL